MTYRRHFPADVRKTYVRFDMDSCKDLAGRGAQGCGDFMAALQVQAFPRFLSGFDQFSVVGIQFHSRHLSHSICCQTSSRPSHAHASGTDRVECGFKNTAS